MHCNWSKMGSSKQGTIYMLFLIFQLDPLYSAAYSGITWNIWTPMPLAVPGKLKNRKKIDRTTSRSKTDRKWTLLAKGSSSFVLLTRFELFGSSLEAPSQSKVFPVTRSRV